MITIGPWTNGERCIVDGPYAGQQVARVYRTRVGTYAFEVRGDPDGGVYASGSAHTPHEARRRADRYVALYWARDDEVL